MVDVATAVEGDGCTERDLGREVGGRHRGGLGLKGRVQIGDVGLVVLGVVELHDLAGDVGFEGLDGTLVATGATRR